MQNNKIGNIVVEKKRLYRHGELGLLVISTLPKGLKETKTNVLMTGSHSNSHTFDKGKIYLKSDGQTFGYLVADNTKLFHPEHSPKGAKIKDGIYQLIKQQEVTPDGFRPIVD
jgi:hypothetical protein